MRPRTKDPQCNEAFFHCNLELLGLGRQIGQINSGEFGVFWRNYQLPFWYSDFLVHVFVIQPLFLQKTKPLYPLVELDKLTRIIIKLPRLRELYGNFTMAI